MYFGNIKFKILNILIIFVHGVIEFLLKALPVKRMCRTMSTIFLR